jgi:hypothetical protein
MPILKIRVLKNPERRIDDEAAQHQPRRQRPGPPRIATLCLGESMLSKRHGISGHQRWFSQLK